MSTMQASTVSTLPALTALFSSSKSRFPAMTRVLPPFAPMHRRIFARRLRAVDDRQCGLGSGVLINAGGNPTSKK